MSSGDSGYGVEYPGRLAVRHRRRRHLADAATATRAAGPRPPGRGAGSGCSRYDAKPSWQTTPAARGAPSPTSPRSPTRTPASPSTTHATGARRLDWSFGGTSASAPIIAGVYALAGNAGAATLPARTRTPTPASLFDVTTGSNGSCAAAYLCTAGAGYDGPTGLGTPNGTGAF